MIPELSIYKSINDRGKDVIGEIGADLAVRFGTRAGSVLGLPDYGVDLAFVGSPASINYVATLRTEPVRAAQDYNDGLRDASVDRRVSLSDSPDDIFVDIDELDQGIVRLKFLAVAIADTSQELTIPAMGERAA